MKSDISILPPITNALASTPAAHSIADMVDLSLVVTKALQMSIHPTAMQETGSALATHS